jgi:hypothetical protein
MTLKKNKRAIKCRLVRSFSSDTTTVRITKVRTHNEREREIVHERYKKIERKCRICVETAQESRGPLGEGDEVRRVMINCFPMYIFSEYTIKLSSMQKWKIRLGEFVCSPVAIGSD